jgi:gamma-glutamylputrescine oxidase
MLSYWEKKHFIDYDLIVIGAGIVGLSSAIQYRRKHPNSKVLVLERGLMPSGASTKNAGFACFGSLTEILSDLNHMTEDEVTQLVELRYKGLEGIRKEFGDAALGYEASGGYELITAAQMHLLDQISYVNSLLKPLFKQEVYKLCANVKDFGFGNVVKAIVGNELEGELDSGAFLNTLWKTCLELQIKIITGAEVFDVDSQDGNIKAKSGVSDQIWMFVGKKIAVCTNAFTKKLLPNLEVLPGRGLILLSKPVSGGIPWKGSFHYDEGYVYFRNIDNRLLIGGGRNKDIQGESTTEFGVNPKIKNYLLEIIDQVVFPRREITISMEWSGIMAFGTTKKPLIQKLSPRVGIAVRLGGMGVAIGWQAASELLKLMDED